MGDIPVVNIVPSTITQTKIITSLKVIVIGLELFKSVTLEVKLFDENGGVVDIKGITLAGDDYLSWNNDDQYIINKVVEILGFTPQ
jgi:hypothetical protein